MADWSTAVGNEFIQRNGHFMPQMKTQKLVFIANGWNWALYDEPLVSDTAEAWDNGPVYRRIWDRIRDFGTGEDGRILSARKRPIVSTNLSSRDKAIIDHVWKKYKGCSADELSRLTHNPDTPWTRAYFGVGRNTPIKDEDVREHYRALALAGRASLA